MPIAAVCIKFENEIIKDASIGNGTMDSIFKTIDRITNYNGELSDYKVRAVTKGKDALAKVICRVSFDDSSPSVIGHGLNIDTMLATADAYLSALNSYLSQKHRVSTKKEHQV